MKIPRCMSTQHPDNVTPPFFAEDPQLSGEDEIEEAYYVFSHLGCDEQMWDCEGKEVDDYVVKKLLTKYDTFFREKVLGRDLFITLRVPNPTVEKDEAKTLLETLESIPRSFDTARAFYREEMAPIFEVILPMTTSHRCLDRIYRYYMDFVVGKQDRPFKKGDITIAEWIGEFKPERINVIPLFEGMEYILEAHTITRRYLEDKDLPYQRVFLARSDPALNYGLVSAVLLNKIALARLWRLSRGVGVAIHPIIGVGSAPFRGNLKPSTVDRVVREYPSVQTFTIQSAFKYDNPPDEVREAIRKLSHHTPSPPHEVDEEGLLDLIRRYSEGYQRQVVALAPYINRVASHVPSRRKRKLHIGLFGYWRRLKGIPLPRAITFTAALYSMGIPPEVLGIDTLKREDMELLKVSYLNFKEDLRDALRYLNPDTDLLPRSIIDKLEELSIDFEIDREHKEITDHVMDLLRSDEKKELDNYILRAANIRRFLG